MTSGDLNIGLSENIYRSTFGKDCQELSNAALPVFPGLLSFEKIGVVILNPPPVMAKVAQTPTRARDIKVGHPNLH